MKKIIWLMLVSFWLLAETCAVDAKTQVNSPSLFERLRLAGISNKEIMKVFFDKRVALYPQILNKKGKRLDYFDEKFGLFKPESINRGKDMLIANKTILEKIEKKYNVNAEIIISFFRIETNFGDFMGEYAIFNSFYTFVVYKDRRATWAESELVNLMVLSKQINEDPLTIKGSWAGCFGLFQFLPSSYLNFAVDGNGDNRIDLFMFDDAAFSAANYLVCNGWQKGNIERVKKSIYSYNHCENYVKAILAYADKIR